MPLKYVVLQRDWGWGGVTLYCCGRAVGVELSLKDIVGGAFFWFLRSPDDVLESSAPLHHHGHQASVARSFGLAACERAQAKEDQLQSGGRSGKT